MPKGVEIDPVSIYPKAEKGLREDCRIRNGKREVCFNLPEGREGFKSIQNFLQNG